MSENSPQVTAAHIEAAAKQAQISLLATPQVISESMNRQLKIVAPLLAFPSFWVDPTAFAKTLLQERN